MVLDLGSSVNCDYFNSPLVYLPIYFSLMTYISDPGSKGKTPRGLVECNGDREGFTPLTELVLSRYCGEPPVTSLM